MTSFDLRPHLTPGAAVQKMEHGGWRLEIPPGDKGEYRLAQLDDYSRLPRRDFAWRPGFRLQLQARASAAVLPGTWGFGLWNDPFSMGVLSGTGILRLPALPNAAWFFFASPPNYLSLRDDLPAQGNLAAVFRSPRVPPLLLALGAPLLAVCLVPPVMRLLRRWGRRVIRQDAVDIALDPTAWHTYALQWLPGYVHFLVDGETVLQSAVVPRGPLGLVLWVDNQYAALPPSGRLGYGTLPTPEGAWVEVRELSWGRVNGDFIDA